MPTKAANYIQQLDAARSNGDWEAVPELIRKVRKHAPQRQCLALTAESECAISNIGSGSSRPSIAETAQSLDVASRIPNLENAIDAESHNKQDVFQARVCVGWLHWVVADYGQALNSLPDSLDSIGLENRDSLTEWTSVCAMKSSYLKANCLMRGNDRQAALASFQAGLPSLDRVWNGQPLHSQLKYWSELFLTEYCMLTSESIRDGQNSASKQSSVACFRAWARYWEAMAAPVAGGYGFKGTITSVPRRTIWSEYYQALSKYVLRDETYPPANLGKASADTPARTQLRMELKRVEASYEKLLLSETSFPRANEERTEVEQFIRQVMSNWSILCGRGWSEFDLGQGGRAGISRGVLETLYRAATKTYHSTIILRSLFSVHLSLSEFDLAFKALESYLEIVKKGKARVDKTGILEPSLDDDGTVLETMAQAVMALCRYGQHESAEKARHLGAELEDWLSKVPQARTAEAVTPTAALADGNVNANHYVSPSVIALAWQAIGLSHANWSRATYEASSRTEIQAKAIRCLRKSLASEFGRSKDTRSIFALSLLLAERKDIAAAVELTRSALMARKEPGDAEELYHGPYWQERSLIPLWHLLGLLLSARQEYAMAAKACEGATSQFKDSTILFGKSDSFKSDHLNSAEAKNIAPETQGGLVDEMDVFEQENLLEVKRTQLALIELQEGPNAAVNASSELLSLFTRLFGNVSVAPGLQPGSSSVSDAPKTARSIRGSIFGSQKDRSRPPTRQVSMATMSDKGTAVPIRPASVQTANPSIQITDEARSPRSRRNSQQSDSGRRNSLKKRNRSESRGRATGNGTQSPQPTVMDGDAFFTPTTEINQLDMMPSNKGPPPAMANFSRDKAVTSLNSYLSKGTEFSDLNLDITHSTPHLLPLVQLPKEKERSRRTAILANVWLTVAGFYRRANMLNECKAAVGEAQKLVQGLESEASRDPATTGAMKPAWAERQTIEELWGSVYSELGSLSLASGDAYAARADFESALTHCPNHTSATVGLSNILLDVYSQKLLPAPVIPPLDDNEPTSDPASLTAYAQAFKSNAVCKNALPSLPLGLGPEVDTPELLKNQPVAVKNDDLPAPYKATSLPISDRLAARDRAYTLLTGLTRLGAAWDNAEAWFTLARAYEESGQPDKAKEVLWWCVELEEATGVRSWRNVATGGYIV